MSKVDQSLFRFSRSVEFYFSFSPSLRVCVLGSFPMKDREWTFGTCLVTAWYRHGLVYHGCFGISLYLFLFPNSRKIFFQSSSTSCFSYMLSTFSAISPTSLSLSLLPIMSTHGTWPDTARRETKKQQPELSCISSMIQGEKDSLATSVVSYESWTNCSTTSSSKRELSLNVNAKNCSIYSRTHDNKSAGAIRWWCYGTLPETMRRESGKWKKQTALPSIAEGKRRTENLLTAVKQYRQFRR